MQGVRPLIISANREALIEIGPHRPSIAGKEPIKGPPIWPIRAALADLHCPMIGHPLQDRTDHRPLHFKKTNHIFNYKCSITFFPFPTPTSLSSFIFSNFSHSLRISTASGSDSDDEVVTRVIQHVRSQSGVGPQANPASLVNRL